MNNYITIAQNQELCTQLHKQFTFIFINTVYFCTIFIACDYIGSSIIIILLYLVIHSLVDLATDCSAREYLLAVFLVRLGLSKDYGSIPVTVN